MGGSSRRKERLVESVAADLRVDLLAARPLLDEIGNHAALWSALDQFSEPFSVSHFQGADADAGFRVAGSTIEFNSAPILGVWLSLLARKKDKELRRALARRVTDQFLLHELDHAAHGFLQLKDVRAMARMSSPHFVGLLDLEADFATAQRAAMVEVHREDLKGRDFYLWHLLQELLLMVDHWLPQVKAPRSKPHKLSRFAGLSFSAARLGSGLN